VDRHREDAEVLALDVAVEVAEQVVDAAARRAR
jgi:hypothetical protein